MFPTLYSLRLIFYRSEWPDETDFVTAGLKVSEIFRAAYGFIVRKQS